MSIATAGVLVLKAFGLTGEKNEQFEQA